MQLKAASPSVLKAPILYFSHLHEFADDCNVQTACATFDASLYWRCDFFLPQLLLRPTRSVAAPVIWFCAANNQCIELEQKSYDVLKMDA
eukprot:2876372-Pleurochrysis_carterae.AAC.2